MNSSSAPIIESADSDSEDAYPTNLKRKKFSNEQIGDKRPRLDLKDDGNANTIGNGSGGAVGCFNCGKSGHLIKDCPLPKAFEKKICYLCNQRGHTSKFCPSTGSSNTNINKFPSFDQTSLLSSYPYGAYPFPHPYGYPHPPQQQQQQQQLSQQLTQLTTAIQSTERRCFICNTKGHLSRDCPDASLGNRCFNCSSRGHVSKDCPKEKAPTKCFTCGQLGHIGKQCPEGQQKVCYHCKSTEHLSSFCPQKPPVSCYNCFSIGHVSALCPQPNRNPTGALSCHTCGQIGHKSAECPGLANTQAVFDRYASYQQQTGVGYPYYR
jgi:hypothetical protein